MSHLRRLEWGEPEARIQKVFESFYEERGNVPNLFRVLGHRPSLFTSFTTHFKTTMGEGAIDVRLKELLAVRVSQINHCRY